ncbi:hypothetical protein ACIRST_22810 [Kitasatospora sp. NPDC101447]|uniref:hypothetical protein n=1 Tax=Kitasatospora sp. NPDC101447 TaxID=3364102 RepID=UPI00380BC94B
MAAGLVLAVLAVPACSADPKARPAAAPGTATASAAAASGGLRAGLLTADRLPPGFQLDTEKVNATTTDPPHTPSPTPIASMPCSELGVESFMTKHARPVEDVAVGVTRSPVRDDDIGWFGQEVLDRYAPGQAAEVMAAIRGVAGRCPSYTDTLPSGEQLQVTASVTPADPRADDSLLLHITSTFPGDAAPWVDETAFIRVGDVILVVQEIVESAPTSGTRDVFAAAVTTYRATAAG